MSSRVYRPLHIDNTTGYPTAIPDGAIINISGTNINRFTIAGKPVMLADGTAADGLSGLGLFNLQVLYNNSADIDGNAVIVLAPGKDFVVKDADDSSAFFKIDSVTGAVTIAGDLIVSGVRTVVDTTVISADHYSLSPNSPNTVALSIEPDAGVSLLAPLVDIKPSYGGPSALVVSNTGNLILGEDLTVNANITLAGTINGVDVVYLRNRIDQHTSVAVDKHQAKEINIWPDSLVDYSFYPTTIKNLQDIIVIISDVINRTKSDVVAVQNNAASLDTRIATLEQQAVTGYTHIQSDVSLVWEIQHSMNTQNFIYQLFDDQGYQVLPDQFIIISDNIIRAMFTMPMAGRVNLMFYSTPTLPQA